MTGAAAMAGAQSTLHRAWREHIVIAAAVFAWLAATAWVRPLMLPDEGRYAGVAWEMLRSGDWLTPTLDGLPYFHKPPLFYWITAASMSIFGAHPWPARAAPLLGACLAALSVHAFALRWSSPRTARLAAITLLVQPLFYLGAQYANLDMLVAGCISVTVLLLAHAALSAERGLDYRTSREAAYAMAAAGVLAKGLIGAVLPALVIVTWLMLRRRWPDVWALVSWRGAVLFAIIASPWFIAMQWRYSDFLDYFFVVQHFKRFATSGFNNAQPFWFYPVVLAVLTLPFLPWLRPVVGRGFFRDTEHGAVRVLIAVWLVVVVAFFSLPQSKLIGYVLPAAPPLAYLVADAFVSAARPSRRAQQLWHASCAVAVFVSVGTLALITLQPRQSTRELALTLAAHRNAGEAVFMLNNYYFDVPFYARLQAPVQVVDTWSSPDVQRRDNWRKELADASRFAPPEAHHLLVEPQGLAASLCQTGASWVIGPENAAGDFPFLGKAQAVATVRGTTLWRVAADAPDMSKALRCPANPHGVATGG